MAELVTHECTECKNELEKPIEGYGRAIDEYPNKSDGKWYVGSTNGEYCSQIFFCPFCGVKLI